MTTYQGDSLTVTTSKKSYDEAKKNVFRFVDICEYIQIVWIGLSVTAMLFVIIDLFTSLPPLLLRIALQICLG